MTLAMLEPGLDVATLLWVSLYECNTCHVFRTTSGLFISPEVSQIWGLHLKTCLVLLNVHTIPAKTKPIH